MCADCKQDKCPSCRTVMRGSKSLLASMLIDNIPHTCKFQGCSKQDQLINISNHEKECGYRLVKCPSCGEEMPFSSLVSHCINKCEDMFKRHDSKILKQYHTCYFENPEELSCACWKSYLYTGEEIDCVLLVEVINGIYEIILVVLGQNDHFKVEVIVHDKNHKPQEGFNLKYYGKPCSIDVKEEERKHFGLMFSGQALNNMFESYASLKEFAVSIKLI